MSEIVLTTILSLFKTEVLRTTELGIDYQSLKIKIIVEFFSLRFFFFFKHIICIICSLLQNVKIHFKCRI